MTKQTGAEAIHWNLADLYESDEALKNDLSALEAESTLFSEKYHGRLNTLDAKGWADLLAEYAEIQDRLGRAGTYAYLHWSTDTTDASRGKLLQQVSEASTAISKLLIFVELEWIALDDDTSKRLLDSDVLDPYRHYLEVQREMTPYVLSEGEEKILAEKSISGRSAWNRFFDETLGAATFKVADEVLSEQAYPHPLATKARPISCGSHTAMANRA